ncbi:MAG: class I SAM-dependent methyltransferase [Syntrophales bacterium]|jgi:2-polyprenyl-3-methyl-5-hydroxy-6-metoxy-1,4-benzoquinol methylase|nr:class I SAM-dependent methyltransferase [Syntrophales bacterium]MCK9528256.1 class I SAM-dependent methyltransferase [Syntrophales bacterium]MDX9922387.1 class I SAM-dependent methyltransferase [Syntrophales bacterium]
MLTADLSRLRMSPGTVILDAGCGAGRHACEAWRLRGINVVAVDMNADDVWRTTYTLKAMDDETEERRDTFWGTSVTDITALPFRDAFFDVVICSEVLEHVPDSEKAVREMVRVLKPGKDMVVSVPRYLPERICWALSDEYHHEPGGHIRIFKNNELLGLLSRAGLRCRRREYRHALHSPYWWLKCFVGHRREDSTSVNLYRKFLEWDIMERPVAARILDRLLNPLMAKSIVYYLTKG